MSIDEIYSNILAMKPDDRLEFPSEDEDAVHVALLSARIERRKSGLPDWTLQMVRQEPEDGGHKITISCHQDFRARIAKIHERLSKLPA